MTGKEFHCFYLKLCEIARAKLVERSSATFFSNPTKIELNENRAQFTFEYSCFDHQEVINVYYTEATTKNIYNHNPL